MYITQLIDARSSWLILLILAVAFGLLLDWLYKWVERRRRRRALSEKHVHRDCQRYRGKWWHKINPFLR